MYWRRGCHQCGAGLESRAGRCAETAKEQIMEERKMFQEWCVVELLGDQQITGLVTEQQIGTQTFMRVKVPNRKDVLGTGFTKIYAARAIYAITPTTKKFVQLIVDSVSPKFAPPWRHNNSIKLPL